MSLKNMKLSESQELGPNQKKYKMIYDLLEDIENRKLKHYAKYKHLRDLQNVLSVSSNVLHTSTVTSLFVMFASVSPVIVIIGAALSSTNLMLSALRQGYRLDDRFGKYKVSQQQYAELQRHTRLTLVKNNLNSEQIIDLIASINTQLDLIQDSSIE
jgi:hypothetical protein